MTPVRSEADNIGGEVRAQALRNPTALALAEWDARGRETRLDFGGLEARTAAFRAGLAEAGVSQGDRVLMLIPMSIDLYVAILAVIRMGAVCVFADPYLGPKRFDACCASVRPKAFIGVPKAHVFRLLCPNLRKVPVQIATRCFPRWLAKDMGRMIARHADAVSEVAAVSPGDPSLISFTTGSSGEPKGSNRTHGFLRRQMEALSDPRKTACTTDFPCFPILPLENLARGRSTYIPRVAPGKVREAGATVVTQAQAWKPEMMSGSPAYLEAVADAALAARVVLDSVKMLFTGGAPITAKALEKLTRVWTRAEIVVIYGSTEAEPVSSLGTGELLRECRPLSARGLGFCVGYPVPSLRVILIPLDFRDSETEDLEAMGLSVGRVGEIAVRGPHVNTEYWNNAPGERANKIRTPAGIWHRMGDAGYFDAKGRLWVVGRAHAALPNPHYRVQGPQGISASRADPAPSDWEWIFPYQVECVVDEMLKVRKSAYLKAMGAHWVVVETVDGSLDDPDLAAAIRSALGDFPLAGVRFINRLPVDQRHNSKVEYAKVKALLEGKRR
ncbi:MAG: AMP-binding protein [Fibrobacteria bacterium]